MIAFYTSTIQVARLAPLEFGQTEASISTDREV